MLKQHPDPGELGVLAVERLTLSRMPNPAGGDEADVLAGVDYRAQPGIAGSKVKARAAMRVIRLECLFAISASQFGRMENRGPLLHPERGAAIGESSSRGK